MEGGGVYVLPIQVGLVNPGWPGLPGPGRTAAPLQLEELLRGLQGPVEVLLAEALRARAAMGGPGAPGALCQC